MPSHFDLAAHLSRARRRDTAASACEAWRPDLRKLWRCVHSVTWLKAGDEDLTALAALCPQLKRLDVRKAYDVRDAGMRALAAGCPQLQSLRLYGAGLSQEGVMAAARALPQLQDVSLDQYWLVGDEGLAVLATHCPRLRALDMAFENATNGGIAAAVARWPELERLNLSGIPFLTVAAYRAVGASCPRLRALKTGLQDGNVSPPAGYAGRTDACVHAVADGCPLLQELDLTGWDCITDAALVAVASRCPQLERLALSRCERVTDVGVIAVTTRCQRLRTLDVQGCELVTVDSMLRGLVHCRELEELSLRFAGAPAALLGTQWPRLRKVSVDRPCYLDVTNGDIAMLAGHCPALQSLTLNGCAMLTDAAVLAVAAHCPRLEELDLSRCSALTDASLLAVAANCPRLSRLDVCYCQALTDASITAVVRSCTRLAALQAAHCQHLTDAVALCVVEAPHGLSSLRSLTFSACSGMSAQLRRGFVGPRIRTVLERLLLGRAARASAAPLDQPA
jgi:hypothetical protein